LRLKIEEAVFAFGHLGLGKKIAAGSYGRFSPAERRAFFLGTLLPDLIDKPLFYIPFWLTGRRCAIMGLFSGTHLFAHTGLFLLVLVITGLLTGSLLVRAIVIGVVTHCILDCVGSADGLGTLLWPLFGRRFSAYPFRDLGQHLATILNPVTLAGEVSGAAILCWDYWTAAGRTLRARIARADSRRGGRRGRPTRHAQEPCGDPGPGPDGAAAR
jgi:hypothetical protein